MKHLTFLIFLFGFYNSVSSQCVVDAGEDIIACLTNANREDTISLDGKIVSGDVEEIEWSAMRLSDGSIITKNILQDSTILNPDVDLFDNFDILLTLKGFTSNNEICTDSLFIKISSWGYFPTENAACKGPYDTIGIWSIAWPELPATYEWSPNYMISDTTAEFPEVWNDTTTVYSLKITDTLGCVEYSDPFESYVKIVSVDQLSKVYDLSIYPNPSSAFINIETDKIIRSINLLAIDGQLITNSSASKIDISQVPDGSYVIQIIFSDGLVRSESIVIRR